MPSLETPLEVLLAIALIIYGIVWVVFPFVVMHRLRQILETLKEPPVETGDEPVLEEQPKDESATSAPQVLETTMSKGDWRVVWAIIAAVILIMIIVISLQS